MPTTLVLIAASIAFAVYFFRPRMLGSNFWRATVTPLASIVGSGFLIAGPILYDAAGTMAWLAMLGLCGLAYLFGAAVRENILHIEDAQRTPLQGFVNEAAGLVLAGAYFISVAYYLNLFAAFGLRLGDITDPFIIRIVATSAIAAIGATGAFGGLGALESLEVGTVGLKLSVIGGLLVTMALAAAATWLSGESFPQHEFAAQRGWDEIRTILGLVVLVQGFETSRYLGGKYDAEMRVRTMRRAQWIAMGIYVVFITLFLPYFTGEVKGEGAETAIIDMLAPLSIAVTPLLIAAALASQSSAAIADTNGAGGLIAEASRRRVPVKAAYLLTAAVAIVMTWGFHIFEIITWASRAFVAYYALQAFLASSAAAQRGAWAKAGLYGAACLLAVTIIFVAKPAEA
ncbi:hypothetical protein [Henriciella aquimarina]|uniref:hypothetical protein n=1 Tax=Henriciella aquimarina TaxID=545261 RepID=UPI0009FD276D|nr:hypothetical protein [Henriciella aquimarina]